MYNFVPSLTEDLRHGKRASHPYFDVIANRSSDKSTNINFTEKTTPAEFKIPRMHSSLVPNFIKLRKMQEIAQRDDGYRLYAKFPVQRAIYRGLWAATGVTAAITLYKWFHFMKELR